MINTKQLNKTIDELESEIQNIKSISKIYDELSNLSNEVKDDKDLHTDLIKNISNISKELQNTSSSLISSVDKVNKVLSNIGQTVEGNLLDIKKENKIALNQLNEEFKKIQLNINVRLSDSASNLVKQYEDFSENINSKYDNLNEEYIKKLENLKEIIELNSSKLNENVMLQFDKNERTIINDIKNQNYEIQNSLVGFINSHIDRIEGNFLNKQKEDQLNAKVLKVLLITTILIQTLSVVLSLVK